MECRFCSGSSVSLWTSEVVTLGAVLRTDCDELDERLLATRELVGDRVELLANSFDESGHAVFQLLLLVGDGASSVSITLDLVASTGGRWQPGERLVSPGRQREVGVRVLRALPDLAWPVASTRSFAGLGVRVHVKPP